VDPAVAVVVLAPPSPLYGYASSRPIRLRGVQHTDVYPPPGVGSGSREDDGRVATPSRWATARS